MQRSDEIIDSWKQLLTDDELKLFAQLSPDQLEEFEQLVYPNKQQEQNAVRTRTEHSNESAKVALRLMADLWRKYTLHRDLKAGNRLTTGRVEVNRSPRAAEYILFLIPKRNREHLVGDLEEEYRTKVLPEWGPFRARLFYWEQTAIAVVCYVWPVLKRLLGLAAIWKVIGK